MADQVVQITAGSGTKIDVSELTVGANTVERQRINIADPTNASGLATVFAGGQLRVTPDPRQLFYDAFDLQSLDTVNRWSAPVTIGGGTATAVLSLTTVSTGTTANGFAYVSSQPSFSPQSPGWLFSNWVQNFEFPIVANSYRFWGNGTPAATPTATAPLIDGYGWEIATDGKLYAVCYAGGTRNQIADLSTSGTSKQVTDASAHNYTIFWRPDRAYWTIDGYDNIVATTTNSALGPNVNTLPLIMMAVAGATPPVSSCVNQCNAVYVADTTGSHLALADGTFPWRQATVTAAGQLVTKTLLADNLGNAVSVSPQGDLNVTIDGLQETQALILEELTEIRILLADAFGLKTRQRH